MRIGRTSAIEQPYGIRNEIYKSGASVKDIMKVVLDTHQKTIGQTKEFAEQLDLTTYQGLRKLWRIGRFDIKYKIDKPGVEIVKSPAYLWKVRNTKGGDCKSLSVFFATTLENAGHKVVYRLCHFGDADQAHVFPVVLLDDGNEIIMDAVHHTFNEMPPNIKWRIDYNPSTARRSNRVGSLLQNQRTKIQSGAIGVGGYVLTQQKNPILKLIGFGGIALSLYDFWKNLKTA